MSRDALRILVVDDELAIRRFLRTALDAHGYKVFEVASGREAIQAATAQKPDLILLDLGLPDIDGVEVIRQLREWMQTPIIVLSVREQESEKVTALDAGADNYLTKPFSTGELLARIRVALRHFVSSQTEPVIEIGDLKIDLARRLVTVGGAEILLTPTEYKLLSVLARHAGKVLTHKHLLREVWGPGYETETHLLRVNISNLRSKIEPDPTRPRYIHTESGVGYRLRSGQ